VVREGTIIGEGWNQVIANNDPTAHGEVSAIRNACRNIKDFDLSGCEIHTTGEPCPMCLGAIHWARIGQIYYGFRIEEAARGGFDDLTFYDSFARPAGNSPIPAAPSLAVEAAGLIDEYLDLEKRTHY
jgi:tRNA(Arg) A34 adenosine deaminase TadA